MSRKGWLLGPWGLQLVVATVFAAIVIAIAGGLVWFNHREVKRLLGDEAQSRFTDSVDQVREEIRDRLHLATAVLDTASLTVTPDGPPVAQGRLLTRMLGDIDHVLPAVTALYVGRGNGDLVMARQLTAGIPAGLPGPPPADAAYSIELVTHTGEGGMVVWMLADAQGRELERTAVLPTGYDPRDRPWYRAGLASASAVTTEPYRFVDMPETGITIARRSRVQPGMVFGIDLTLAALDRYLDELTIATDQELLIFERSGALVASAGGGFRDLINRGGRMDRAPRITDLGSPILAGLYRAFADGRAGKRLHLDAGGQSYLAHIEPLGEPAGNLVVAAAIPLATVVGPADRIGLTALGIGLVATLAAVLIVLMAARSISRPLRLVTGQLGRVMRFEPDEVRPPPSRIREIEALGGALTVLDLTLKSFATFVPSQIVRRIVAHKQSAALGGRRQALTVMFTDVTGFTSMAEGLPPEHLMVRTSRYFSAVARELIATGGTVDKYIGDSVMAFWNAPELQPDHVERACRGALRAMARVDQLNAELVAEGGPPMPTRIGIHTGEAVVGNIGSIDRMNYTALGHVVNVAARLEALNKEHGATILVSEPARRAAGDAFRFRAVAEVVPRGARESLAIYELLGPASTAAETADEPAAAGHS
jgi:adenylate cyclase